MFPKQLMFVHDAEHDFKNSVSKIIDYVKCEFKFFYGPQISNWSVVGSFKENLFI